MTHATQSPTKLDKAIRFGKLGLCAHTAYQFRASAKFYAICRECGFVADELYDTFMRGAKYGRPNLPR